MRPANFQTIFKGRRLCLLPLLLLTTVSLAWGQSTGERDHFQVRIGVGYDRGDFGSPETTKVLYVPVTLRYLGERFDLSVTPSFARMDTVGGVRLIDGVPTVTGESTSVRETRSSAGDTIVRGRFYLLETDGLSVSPFMKVKIPTAPEDLEMGTGKADYGFGVEVDKQVSRVLLFGDLNYTVTGKVPGLNLRNRVGGSMGVGRNVSDAVFVGGMVDWRRALVLGSADPAELVGIITFRPRPTVSISPNAYVGLSDSSPDVGFGVELSFRFGRF